MTNPTEAIAAVMPRWSNRMWLARKAVAALKAAGYRLGGRAMVDHELAARQILRAYIDDENLVRKAYGELFGGSSSEEDEK